MDFLPFGLLAAALVGFLVSTAQWHFAIRALLLAASLALLGATAVSVFGDRHTGIPTFVVDVIGHGWNASALRATIAGNQHRIIANLAPLLGVFVALTLPLAALSVLALTRGQTLERVIRPAMFSLAGAVGGGLFALAVVALGAGGYHKDRTYAALGSRVEVVDGDTLRLGDVSLRLVGIDAPEDHQPCGDGSDCGAKAAARLKGLVASEGIILVCRPTIANSKPPESFGRPLVRCDAYGARRFDVAEEMALSGYADVYRKPNGEIDSPYCRAVAQAKNRGLWLQGVLRPSLWRNDAAARASFLAGERFADDDDLNDCAKQLASGRD